jgi:hypothetical protein
MSLDVRGAPLGIRVTTYADLEKLVQAFARGDLQLLILLGSHGLGKSRIVRQALPPQPACWLDGNTSVFGLYCQLWHHRHQPVILDDLDGLYASRDGVRLLKCLTQSEAVKRVSWHTDAPTLVRDNIPQQFTTTSSVAIITNDWKTLNRDVAALQDRGHVVLFQPSAAEVHRRTADWFWDQEIFDFLGERLPWLAEVSMRHYLAAWELKQAGLDWRSLVLSRCLSGRALLVAQLKADPRYRSEAERLQAFQAQGGGSRSTYFNWSRRLQTAAAPAPAIKLNNPPPARRLAEDTVQKILRRWNQHFGEN